MSNPTTPFSWQMPTATDLVTDLPADFEVFGQAVATSMADLLGGTTGQILAKNSNTDMDFVWSAPTSGSMTAIASGNIPTGTSTLSLTSISGAYTHLQLHVIAWNGSGNNTLIARLNGDTGSNYTFSNSGFTTGSARASGLGSQTSFNLCSGDSAVSGNNKNITVIDVPFYTNATTGKVFQSSTGFLDAGSARAVTFVNGYYSGTNAAVTQIDFIYGSNWSGGSYVLYGVK